MILKIFGYDVSSVSVITDDDMRNTYLQSTYLFKGWENQPPFPCAMQGAANRDSFTISIVGTDATIGASMIRSPHWQDSLLFRYAPQIIAISKPPKVVRTAKGSDPIP